MMTVSLLVGNCVLPQAALWGKGIVFSIMMLLGEECTVEYQIGDFYHERVTL